MSVHLRDAIFDSDLPADEKFLALTLIKFAKRDGTSIFPSRARLAWMMGRKVRAIQYGINKLKARGVLEALSGQGGGSSAVHYRFHAEALPTRASYDIDPCNLQQVPVQLTTLPVQPVAHDPAIMIQPRTNHMIQSLSDEEKTLQRRIAIRRSKGLSDYPEGFLESQALLKAHG